MVVQVVRLAVVLWVQLYLLAPEMTKLPMLVEHYREHTGANSALDISAFLEYRFYEPILYLDSDETFPSSKEKPGWWVGVANGSGKHIY